MSKALVSLFNKLGACDEATEWVKTQTSRQSAWENCQRSDWMLWIIARSSINWDDPKLRLMACDFAEAVLYLVPAGENRPAEAIRIARLFAAGEATREEMDAAWAAAGDAARDAAGDAAWASAWAAARAAAWDAAWASAWAAARDAAGAAAWAAAWASARDAAGDAARDAAWAAARAAAWDAARAAARAAAGDAAWDAARDAARAAARAKQADIIRGYFPKCPTIKAGE